MTKPKITLHYADGRPSETVEMTEEEYEALLATGWTLEGKDETPTAD